MLHMQLQKFSNESLQFTKAFHHEQFALYRNLYIHTCIKIAWHLLKMHKIHIKMLDTK